MMKNRIGFTASLCALLLLALTSTIHAEVLNTIVRLTPEAAVPPPATPPIGLSVVTTAVIFHVDRDASGNVIAGTVYFHINLTTTEVVELTGIHLREGVGNANGPIRIDTGLSGWIINPNIPETITIAGVSA